MEKSRRRRLARAYRSMHPFSDFVLSLSLLLCLDSLTGRYDRRDREPSVSVFNLAANEEVRMSFSVFVFRQRFFLDRRFHRPLGRSASLFLLWSFFFSFILGDGTVIYLHK